MTYRARWMILLAVIGLIAGLMREQVVLALLSLTTFLWILVEWIRFQARLHFLLPHLHLERRVNGRANATGSLWAGRKVQIEIRIRNLTIHNGRTNGANTEKRTPFAIVMHFLTSLIAPHLKLIPVIHFRDVVPEILEIIPVSAPQASTLFEQAGEHSSLAKRWVINALLKLNRWLSTRIPFNPTHPSSPNEWTLDAACQEESFGYVALLRAAGSVTLPGVRLTVEDNFALFRVPRFYELSQTFRILPDYFQSGELRPTVKRHNSLPKHGIHRLQREGAGSELLELREYVPGDPPKSIAWKVSARRNKLMTRKYESEVPVRVHLFIDGSISTRSGGYGRRLLDQINYVAASVAKAATAVGDPVGGMLVDESGAKRLAWMSGDRGFMQLLKSLSDFAHASPPVATHISSYMMNCARSVCHERYPELLDRRYHQIPFSLRATTRERFRVVGVLAQLHRLPAQRQIECYYDDKVLAVYLQEFLFDAGLPWMAPLFSVAAEPGVIGVRTMKSLSDAMSKAIAHARDNEVFVIFADPFTCAPNLSHLLRVVKLALAKHHRVAFICPTSTFSRPNAEVIKPDSGTVADLLFAAELVRIREVAQYLKRELVRLGVAVSFSGEQSAMRMVLSEMDLARDGRSTGQGIRR